MDGKWSRRDVTKGTATPPSHLAALLTPSLARTALWPTTRAALSKSPNIELVKHSLLFYPPVSHLKKKKKEIVFLFSVMSYIYALQSSNMWENLHLSLFFLPSFDIFFEQALKLPACTSWRAAERRRGETPKGLKSKHSVPPNCLCLFLQEPWLISTTPPAPPNPTSPSAG